LSGETLHDLARAVGLSVTWLDYRGQRQMVTDEALAAILAAMGRPAATRGELASSLEQVRGERRARPALVTAVRDEPVQLRAKPGLARLQLEDGRRRDLTLRKDGRGMVSFRAPRAIGYHRLEFDDGPATLAVTPRRALRVADLVADYRAWGVAAQLYSLNQGGDFGDFGDLGRFASELAARGADAVAVSPTHALFTGDLGRYAPYGPSTRLFLNPLYAALSHETAATVGPLIDWRAGGEAKMARLRQAYETFLVSGENRATFEAFVREGGKPLLGHARFEALYARFYPQGLWNWRDWPDGYADADSPVVQALSPTYPAVQFQLFLQWRVAASAEAAQAAARSAGMAIGLISDLAVGMDGAGSDAWSLSREVLHGLSIGAPPDLLAERGQSWGLTTFSPAALRARGFEPFLATLRAVLAHAGGVRIDHAIGLQRLWVSPAGAHASEGAYLDYPFDDLLRLIALESHRHSAVVIGEDLGTVPPGFRERSARAGMAGMRVLWFERTRRGGFSAPSRWGRQAAAMTTTHDLPTVAGWWRGRDIDWRAKIDGGPEPEAARDERAADRKRLWRAMIKSGAAEGHPPAAEETDLVVDAALAHVAASECDLALIAIEDVLGLVEQPNLPGTTDQHPNWRRRLPAGDGLDDPRAIGRLDRLARARRKTP
jgi:4-alpha-glucanotransferase